MYIVHTFTKDTVKNCRDFSLICANLYVVHSKLLRTGVLSILSSYLHILMKNRQAFSINITNLHTSVQYTVHIKILKTDCLVEL